MPFVARDVYAIDQTGLSHMIAGFGCGALIGSVAMAVTGGRRRNGRFMMINLLAWYAVLAVFAQVETKAAGVAVLFVMGIVHSMAMIAMTGVLLGAVAERFRARVMGIRMLAVYSLPVGLIGTSPLIERLGYAATASLYVVFGVVTIAAAGWFWRRYLWR